MPINAYTGLMGSGKSFECVVSVIIPAIKSGRDVVTNVDGIDSDAIRAYILEHNKAALPEQLGHVRHCTNEQVSQPDFLPFGKPVDTFCQPGDLVCIDEAWRFWGTDCKLLPEHKIFFREHRHYVSPKTGMSSDLVLMVQDIGDLHRTLKVVVELSFRTTKIKSLGLNKIYRVEMWEGYKQVARSRVSVQNKKYDKAIFPLYSSYTGGSGTEVQVDSRQNIFNSKVVWFYIVAMLVLGTVAGFAVKRFFTPPTVSAKAPLKVTPLPPPPAVVNADGSISRLPKLSGALVAKSPEFSAEWRYAGLIEINGVATVLLLSPTGTTRFESPSAFRQNGLYTSGEIDGKTVTRSTGQFHVIAAPKMPALGGVK